MGFTLEILTTKANNFFQVLKMNEKSRNPLEKRPSSIRAKKVDYAALQEIKIEEVDCDDDFDDTEPKLIAPSSPPKKKGKTHQSAKESEIVTDEKCGLCPGCRRKPCSESTVYKCGLTFLTHKMSAERSL